MFLIAKAIWQFVTKTDDPNVVCFAMKTEDCRDNTTKVCFRVSADQEMKVWFCLGDLQFSWTCGGFTPAVDMFFWQRPHPILHCTLTNYVD